MNMTQHIVFEILSFLAVVSVVVFPLAIILNVKRTSTPMPQKVTVLARHVSRR
jgi:hypothetical protein